MSPYYRLIKDKTIDFSVLMLNRYHLLNLSELDAIILIKLHELQKQGLKKLSASKLVPTMSVTANTVSKRLVELVKNGFITLTWSEDKKCEEFSLDDVYKRLSHILEQERSDNHEQSIQSVAKEVANLLETEFKKILTPIDLEMIHHWIFEDNFTFDQIKQAVLTCVKGKKLSLKYVDIFLNKKEATPESKVVENLQELFNNVYDKSK